MKKVRICKKIFSFFLSLSLFLPLLAQTNKPEQYTLENGLSVFLLEDNSDALARIEFTCRAGFSSQTQETAGFFTLYSRLIQSATPQISFEQIQCNADASRYIISTPPSKVEEILETLSQAAFSLFYTDELLNEELSKMKIEVTENAESMAGFINSAIDSRVFADAPWQHDSGIYPALFKRTTEKQARTILKEIGDKWYTPQNSALFISGNINSEKLSVVIKNTFGRYYSTYRTPSPAGGNAGANINTNRKFVIHNPEFSPELTQVVVQYTSLEMDQADLLAATLNSQNSNFKQNALKLAELNIPGDEYINVSSAHKKDSSRLIFQTLMQPPENKNIKTTAYIQAEKFLGQIKQAPLEITVQDLQYANLSIENQKKITRSSSNTYMDYLASYWAIEPFIHPSQTDLATLQLAYTTETPFIFVIINSDEYNKCKKDFETAGYTEITTENASWYVQELHKEINDAFKPEERQYYNISNRNSNDNNFYNKNLAQIHTATLSNGIPVITRKNDFSDFLTILLSIKGGKLNSADNNGFEDSMVYLLSIMIQNEIYKLQMQGLILGSVSVSSKTDIATSSITINCETEDFVSVCNAISTAMIFGEVKPANADRAVSSRQYKKRLENGSAANQLQSAALTTLFGKNNFSALFDTDKDILLDTTYTSILEAYSALLDASRYTVILCGNFYEDSIEVLNNTIGLLNTNNLPLNTVVPQMNFPKNKAQKVKIRHTFLTDIPAELAGPMPAVLIPTTEFKDPVMYLIKAPEQDEKALSLFNGVMNYLSKALQEAVDANGKLKGATVSVQLPRFGLPFAMITIQNVAKTKEADIIFRNTIRDINNQLFAIDANRTIVQNIKDFWTVTQMAKTASITGTAELLQKGLELFPEDVRPDYYLMEYNFIQSATAQDFMDTMNQIPELPVFRLYSQEAQ